MIKIMELDVWQMMNVIENDENSSYEEYKKFMDFNIPWVTNCQNYLLHKFPERYTL